MKKNSRKFLDFKESLSNVFKSKETKRVEKVRTAYQQALEEVKQREVQEMGRTLTKKELADENVKRAKRILLNLMYDDSVSAKWVPSDEDTKNLLRNNSGNSGLLDRYYRFPLGDVTSTVLDTTRLSGIRKTIEELIQTYKKLGISKPGDMVWFDSSEYPHELVKKESIEKRRSSYATSVQSNGDIQYTQIGPCLEPTTKEELDQLWYRSGYDQRTLEYRNRTHLIPKVNKWVKVIDLQGAQWDSVRVISPEGYTLAMFLGYEEDNRFDSFPGGAEETETNKIRRPKWLIDNQIWVGWINTNNYGVLRKDHFTKGIKFSNDE